MRRTLLIAGLTAMVLVSGCSSPDREESMSAFFKESIQGVKQKLGRLAKKKAPSAKLTRKQLEGFKTPLIEVTVEKTGGFAPLGPIRDNDGAETWFTQTNRSMTFRRGVLIATRGMGFDLMAADARATISRLGRGPAEKLARRMRYMDDENHMFTLRFECDLDTARRDTVVILDSERSARLVRERCKNATTQFVNEYWLSGSGGKIIQSRQWVGEDIGYVLIQRLIE